MSQVMAGGWSNFQYPLSAAAKTVFDETVGKLLGVGYTPVAYATQVVAGTNYCFLCLAKPVYPDASTYVVKAYVYLPLSGAPHISHIDKVAP